MITYNEARKIALSKVSNKRAFNSCTEYEGAFVFSQINDDAYGGLGECVILKQNGHAVNFVAAIPELGKILHDYEMDKDGNLTEREIDDWEDDF